ncbi:MAG: hypothetical protein IJV27_09030 [Prevotella sp.]|nr:hypothetical protein [Prevotella sp.]
MKNMYLWLFWGVIAALSGCTGSQNMRELSRSRMKTGDLLFVVSPESNAITDVTQGFGGRQIDHVGIALLDSARSFFVFEAIPEAGFTATPLDSFVRRNTPTDSKAAILVGRVTADWDYTATVGRLAQFDGVPYDSLFLPDDSAVYCSELVQKAFVDARGRPVFETIPMQFRDSRGQIPQYFLDFYARHGRKVPEGEPGTNPGQLSRSRQVRIVGMLRNR